jgi:hypothetical protein
MTKYILNSGGARNYPELKKKWHLEIVKNLGSSPRFLICNFAQAREYWELKFADYSNSIRQDMPIGVSLIIELAMPDIFVAQCQRSDVIYFPGGDDHLLQYWIKQYDYPKLFDGKVIVTSSASSNMLAKHYWTCDWRQCGDGFGVLPMKFISHYKSNFGSGDPRGLIDWDKAYKELSDFGDPSLPIHALKEGEFIVVEQ